MTYQEQKALRDYCALLFKEYGFQFTPDNPVIPALYIIHKEMEQNNQNNKAIASQVREVSSRISPKEFKFYSDEAAWQFQQGITFRRVLFGVLALLSIWVFAWHWSNVNDVDQARAIIETSGQITELADRATKANDGSYYIYFTRAKADSIRRFKEFQVVNATTIRVNLGKAIGKSKR
jgi:hypothetical protein